MEIEIIKAALAENKKISGWKIVRSEKKGNQLFGVHEKIETARVVDTETTAITVYVDHDSKTGSSTFLALCVRRLRRTENKSRQSRRARASHLRRKISSARKKHDDCHSRREKIGRSFFSRRKSVFRGAESGRKNERRGLRGKRGGNFRYRFVYDGGKFKRT